MIRYALACEDAHAFEAWFASSADYDVQAERGLIECPFCGSITVAKQIMAPAVARGRGRSRAPPAPGPETPASASATPPATMPSSAVVVDAAAGMRRALAEVRRHVERTFDYVGDRFAREARDIHEGVAPARPVYGEASAREVRDLVADGVPIAPLPPPVTAPKKARLN